MKGLLSTFAAMLTLSGTASAQAMNEQRFLALFFQVHDAMPDLANVEAMLSGSGYKVVYREIDARKTSVEYSDVTEDLLFNCDKENYPGLATNIQYAVSLYETDSAFAGNVRKLMSDRLGSTPAPFEDNPGWQATAWPGPDGTDQMAFSISHNEEHQVTRIWGHKLLVGDK